MKLVERVNDELKQAMRARDEHRLNAVRSLRNEIIKLSKQGGEREIADDDVVKLVKTQIKQRQDAIAMFKKGNRSDLIVVEEEQIRVLSEFLPPQLPDIELKKMVEEAVTETGAASIKEMGKVMKTVMEKIRATGKDADNRVVSQLVKEQLSAASG